LRNFVLEDGINLVNSVLWFGVALVFRALTSSLLTHSCQ